MKKWLVILCIALLAVFLLASSAWLWVTRTEGGARWAMARGAGAVERLEYESLTGGLASGITLEGVAFAHAGTRVSAERLQLAARIDLFAGPLVEVYHLRGRGIDVHLPQTEETAETESAPFDLSSLAAPVDVTVEELDLQRLAIHAGGEPVRIARIALAGRYGERIELDRLEVDTEAGQIQAQGNWALRSRGSGRLRIEAQSKIDETTTQSGSLELSGRLDALDFEATGSGPVRLSGRGQLRGLPQSLNIDSEITGSVTDWPGLPLAVEDLALSLSGQPSEWRAESSARVTGPDVPPGNWSLALTGGTQSLTIESLDADVLDGRISGTGSLDWRQSAPASQASLQLESLDLTPLYPQWPNQGRISGALAVTTEDGVIEVESLDLSAEPGKLEVTGAGRIDPAGDSVDVTLEWRQFAWPPVTDDTEPMVASESGRIHLSGKISDWQAQVEAMVETPQTPAAKIEAEAGGNRDSADISRLRIDAGEGGVLALDGRVAWSPALSADLQLALDGFDPGVLVNQLPGRLDGRARIRLSRQEGWQVGVGLESLSGQLRGQPLQGSGRLAWAGDRPENADLTLQLGDNRLALNNRDSAAWRFDLEAVSLEQLWPTMAGQAHLEGEVRPGDGQVELDGRVDGLRYADYNLEQADIELALDWIDQPTVDLTVSARNLDLRPWDRVEQLELTLDGTCDSHQLEVDASGGRGRIGFAAGGRLEECLGGQPQWRGEITRLDLAETLAGDWRLAASLPLNVSAQRIEASAACLARDGETPSRLCLERLDLAETGRVVTRIERVPMDLLLLPIDPVFSLTTPLSGRVEAGWDAAGLSRIDGQLQLGAGALKAIGGEDELLAIDSVRLDLKPGEDTALTAGLRARLEGATEIRGEARVTNLRNLAESRVDGEARLDLPDIAAFAQLIPQVDRIGGSATGRIEVAGPITGPSVSGRLAVHDGRLVHAPLGLDVNAIELELAGSADRATLEGSAASGEGNLALSGQARLLDDGWRLDTRIDGERFTFAGADWLELSASPAISLQARPDLVSIDGDIQINRLRGGLPPGAADRVSPSPDVEVVGEEETGDAPETAGRRRVEGRLGIDLGEDASLATEGFRTELAGALELVWNGPPRPQGQGVIRLPEGAYRAYGQNLEISGGEIIFSGQPIDNPRLDIRAVRDIFGDPEVEAAGVEITGSARNPNIELYTDPPTSEEKALAYVVTGSDFDHAGGQGALNVGFYLLPKLFVSYGVGLFETGNVLSGRYEFSRHWGVRVVSGERDTGVDLSYTVNN
jgi:translocation and assembly module TamB